MDDLASILLADEPTAQERLAALTSTLRRQRAVGTLASLIGGPAKDFGANLTRGADEGLQRAAEAPGQRLRMALQRQQLDSGAADAAEKAAERGAKADPNSIRSRTAAALLSKFMPKMAPPPGATAAQLEPTLGLAEKAYGVDENARQRALTRQMMTGKDAATVGMYDEEAINALADQWYATGKRPPLGMGRAAVELGGRLANAVVRRHPGADLAAMGANYGADSGSLKKLQQQADAIGSFERTALANGDVFMQQARSLGLDTGSPLFNAPYRRFAQQVTGDPKMAAFAAARQTFVQEISKILSGSMGSSAVSDSARHEAEALLGPDASLAQIEAAFNILKTDLANRKQGLAAQLSEIRGRVGSGGGGAAQSPAESGGQDQHAQALQWARAHPGDPRAIKILQIQGVAP